MVTVLKRDMTIDSEHGLHMRSAAMIARKASEFQSDIQVRHGHKTVSAKSTVGLMTLGTPQAGRITVHVNGEDACLAMDAIEALLQDVAFINQSLA